MTATSTAALAPALAGLFDELVKGAPENWAFVLNGGDPGLLASLDRLDARQASARSHGGASIAAHVAHVGYGLLLMNRWAGGEANPWATADWTAAWRTGEVSEDEWRQIRDDLRTHAERWRRSLAEPREVIPVELNGMVASVVHLAYHLGAIRQIDASLRGPKAEASA